MQVPVGAENDLVLVVHVALELRPDACTGRLSQTPVLHDFRSLPNQRHARQVEFFDALHNTDTVAPGGIVVKTYSSNPFGSMRLRTQCP